MRAVGTLVLCLGAACYAPTPQPGAPCTNGACPSGLFCAPATQTCERRERTPADASSSGDPDGDSIPDATVAPPDAPPDAQVCFGAGLVQLCLTAPPTTPLAITANTSINTDSSPLCVAYTGGPETTPLCVVTATSISIADNRRLRATGSRPLVLLSTGAFVVDGTIDVSAGAGANPATCIAPTAATGRQGGAGGSRQGRGGRGGVAPTGTGPSSAPGSAVIAFDGGCRGGNGAGSNPGTGGSGGGALYLIAPALTINGTLNASGDGGNPGTNPGGGGGGGSGGFIGLDAATITVATTARIFANGGGGGEGGTEYKNGNSGSSSGGPTSAASGGSGGANQGGNGGSGSAGASLDGSGGGSGGTCPNGYTNGGGGGGGGGGAGFVYVYPAQPLGGSVAPPPSTPPAQ